MAFSLAPFIGDGSHDNPFRPGVDTFSIIDLRADSTQQAGWCLVSADTVPSGAVDLGELLDNNMPRGVSRNLENRLGVTLDQFSNLRAVIAELLILHGEDLPRGVRTRWRPIKPDHRGMNRIVLGGELVFEAPVIQGAVITESFDKADNGLGPDLTWTNTRGTWHVVSNEAHPAVESFDQDTRAESDLVSDDHYAQVVVTALNHANDALCGPVARFAPAARTFYTAFVGVGPTPRMFLRKVVTGTNTNLTNAVISLSLPDTVRIEVDGSGLSGLVNAVEEVSTTDTDITGNIRTGLMAFMGGTGRAAGDVVMDNFEAGDLGLSDPHVFFDLTDLPADFGNADTAEIVVRTRGVDIGATPLKLFAQIFQSDETTALSDEVEVAEEATDSSFTNSAPIAFTGLNTTADKTVWDAARIRFRWGT